MSQTPGIDALDAMLREYEEQYGEPEGKATNTEGFAKANAARTRLKHKRQEKFLEYFAQGHTIEESAQAAGVTAHSYRHWRKTDKKFKNAVEAVRANLYDVEYDEEGTWHGDFITFRKKFLGWDTYWHQRQIIEAIESAKPSHITMVLAPPEHGKTSTIEDYINYRIATNPNVRITYVHESRDFARKVLGRVAQRMLDSSMFPEYIAKFGPFKDDSERRTWNADALTVAKAKHDERDFTLQVRGWNSSVQGTRTDLLIIDDVQAVKSLNLTEKISQVLRQDYFSRPGSKAKIIMVGTRVGMRDIYEHFLEDATLNPLIDLIELPALDADGNPLCPELWSADDLKLKRALVGEEAWWRNYQQKPMSSGAQTFTTQHLDEAKNEALPACQVKEGTIALLGVDPALGGQNAVVAASYDRSGLYVVDAQGDTGLARTEDILGVIDDFALRYRPLDVVIETTAMQRGLARDDRLVELGRRHGFRIVEHETAGRKSDAVLGVASMAGSFIRREIHIPSGTQMADARMGPLLAELASWRPDIPTRLLRQDLVMALWFIWKFWMERRQTMGLDTSRWDFAGLPWDKRSA